MLLAAALNFSLMYIGRWCEEKRGIGLWIGKCDLVNDTKLLSSPPLSTSSSLP